MAFQRYNTVVLKEIQIAPSTNLAGVAYDADEMTLYVQFRNGSMYAYQRIPEDLVTDLSKAISSGQHFNTFIKSGEFEYERIA